MPEKSSEFKPVATKETTSEKLSEGSIKFISFPQSEEINLRSLLERIERLEQIVLNHQHTGLDGSRNFDGETDFVGKSFIAKATGHVRKSVVDTPISIVAEPAEKHEKERSVNIGIVKVGSGFSEENRALIGVSKKFAEEEKNPNEAARDFDKLSQAGLELILLPNDFPKTSGPSPFPSFAFLRAFRTPLLNSTGTITEGGNTLVDSAANFKPSSLKGGVLTISNFSGVVLDVVEIEDNTRNVITIKGTWNIPSGSYAYRVAIPIFLGSGDIPFSRLYVGKDIRLGYGLSSKTQYIIWGKGSPEGVVKAAVGSLYLRSDGGSGSTLYIKESGGNTANGWVAK
jgi:hypothetical protein